MVKSLFVKRNPYLTFLAVVFGIVGSIFIILCITDVFANPDSDDDPIAYWRFDEGYGTTVYDDSVNNNDGTINGATWQPESMCKSGKCLYFDGVDDYISIPDSSSLRVNEDGTWEAWIYPTNISKGRQGIILKSYNNEYEVIMEPNGIISFYHGDGTWEEINEPSEMVVTENEWNHIVVVRTMSPKLIKFYLNGKYIGSDEFSDTPIVSSTSLTIGKRGSYYFQGFIDEIKIYNRALDENEIKSEYLAGRSLGGSSLKTSSFSESFQSNKGLVGYWKMDEASWDGTSGEVKDYSGNGNDGTAYGNATTAAGRYGNAGSFDGDGDYVRIPHTANLMPSSITVSGWIRFDDTGNWMMVNKAAGGIPGSYYIYGDSLSQGAWTIFGPDGARYDAFFGSFSTGQWYHLVGTFDASTGIMKTYKNGKEIDTRAGAALGSNTADVLIGRYAPGGYYHNGLIDEVKIYNYARTPEQIMAEYLEGPPPVGHWKFDEQTGSVAYDSSGNGINLTGQGLTQDNVVVGQYGSAYSYSSYPDRFVGWDDLLAIHNTLTLEAWIYPLSVPSERYTIILGTGAYYLSYGSDQAVHTYWYGKSPSGYHSSGTNTVPTNEWSHVAAVWEEDNVKLYVNGILKRVIDSTGAGNTASNLIIGAENESRQMVGYIDEVKIYNYARTQRQIIEDMNAGKHKVGPVGWWKFDEGVDNSCADGTSDVCDSSGHSNNGVNNGATWVMNGKFGKALSFDGSDDNIQVNNFDFNILRQGHEDKSWTLEAWVKPNGTQSTAEEIIVGRIGCHGGIYAYPNDFRFAIKTNDAETCWNGSKTIIYAPPDMNSWHHLVAVYDNRNMYFYADGDLVGTSYFDQTMYSYSNILYMGGYSARRFNGLIDEVKVYNYALSSEEVKQEYNRGAMAHLGSVRDSSSTWDDGGLGGDPPVAIWDFEEKTGTTVFDKSGNNNNGTLVNGAGWAIGKYGSGVEILEDDDVIDIPDIGGSDISISMWYYFDDTGGGTWNTLLCRDGGSYHHLLIRDDSREIGFFNNGWYSSGYALTPGQWYHIEVVKSGTNSKIYVNGILRQNSDSSFDNNAYPLSRIGNYGGNSQGAIGKIDQVVVYNYARTPAQVAWDYNRGKPIAHWRFDENTSGNASGQTLWDDSDHDNDGTGYGTDGPVWTTGKLNSALEFDGNDDHVSVSNYSELADILHNHFTYSFWVKYNGPSSSAKWPYLLGPTDTHKYPGVRGGGNYGANPPYLEWGLYPVCDGSSYTTLAVPSETDGEWHHIAFTYDGSVAKAYFDGEYYAQKSQDGMCPGFNNFIIGKQYNGLIDDVRIYNYARTPAQILEDYNAGAIRIGASN